jgi:hypothetical protein
LRHKQRDIVAKLVTGKMTSQPDMYFVLPVPKNSKPSDGKFLGFPSLDTRPADTLNIGYRAFHELHEATRSHSKRNGHKRIDGYDVSLTINTIMKFRRI